MTAANHHLSCTELFFFFVLPFLSYSAPPRFPLLPLRCPVTWQTYNPLRHGLMFWVYFFRALSAECCHSPTLFSLLSKFRSLDFVLSAVKGGGGLSTAWLCCFCGSHDVNLLNVCRPPLLVHQRSWLKTERWRMLVCFCWSTSSQMESKHGFSMSCGCVLQTWTHVVHVFTDGTGIFLIYLRC